MMWRSLILMVLTFGTLRTAEAQRIEHISLPDMDGNSVSLNSQMGDKLTVLDFWATWCKPCINSIPELVKLSERFYEQGVRFVGINADSPRNRAKIKPFSATIGITYPVLLDSDQLLQSGFMIEGFPTLVILNRNGKVLFTHLGFINGDEKIIGEKIEKLLADME